MAGREAPHAALGAKIKAARRRLGMSQEAFAPTVGVTRRHLIRLEGGRHQVGKALAERICAVTGLELADLRPDLEEAARSGERFRGPVLNAGRGDQADRPRREDSRDMTEDAA